MTARGGGGEEGGTKSLCRQEDTVRQSGLSHVGFIDRRGQGVHLGEGKSLCRGAAIFGRGVATETFAFVVPMIHR